MINDPENVRLLISQLPPRLKSTFADHLADVLNLNNDYYVERSIGDRVYSLNSYILWEITTASVEKLAEALRRTLELNNKTT